MKISHSSPLAIPIHCAAAAIFAAALLVISPLAHAQVIQRDAQALSLASQAVTAMAGTATIADATVSANVTYTAGSDIESGTATLEAKGTLESRFSAALSGGSKLYIRNSTGMPANTAAPAGQWWGADGVAHAEAMHNCWTDPAWFFPALSTLSSAAADTTLSAIYVGAEMHNGSSTHHIRLIRSLSGQSSRATQIIATLSTEDVYLDAATLLPLALDFNAHPDVDLGTNMPVEIVFSNYKTLGSGQLPFHIQKYINGTLIWDVTVTGINLNTGIPDSDFTITVWPS